MRLALILALAVAAFAADRESWAWPGVERAVRAPFGSGCECAVQATPTTLAARTASGDDWRIRLLDSLAEPAMAAPPVESVLAHHGRRGDAAPPAGLPARRGYDATAPPAPPLA